jgi:hypothetical protein
VHSALLSPLRPKPFRGDVVAAGAVVLTTLVWVVTVRFADAWGAGAHLAYAALACAFVSAMGVLSPVEGDEPRAYQSVLYVASVALFIDVVAQLSRVLGADEVDGSGTATWVLVAIAAFALTFAIRRNSAVCTLLGSLAGGLAVIMAVEWIWSPDGFATDRWVLLALMTVFGIAAIGQRDRRPRHGVALIDAAGLAVLAIAASFIVAQGLQVTIVGDETPAAPGVAWGWELLILAAGFGLVAYSSVDRQPGPAYFGVLNLIAFTAITSLEIDADGATLLGWPLVLALAAGFLLVIGLRPTTPAPPPPDIDAPEPPPLPLR